MDPIIFVLVGLVVGVVIGYRVADAIHKAIVPDLLRRAGVTPEKLTEVMQDLQKEIEPEAQTASETEIAIKAEQHGEMIYVFRKQDDQFLAQGRNYTEIIAILRQRYPQNHKFTITPEDGAQHLEKPAG